MVLFGRHRTNTDIYPSNPVYKYPPQWTFPCPTPRTSSLHFLNIPNEIRRLIFHEYFLSLNLPDHFFHHLTFLGYWGKLSGPDTTAFDPRGFDLGRKIRDEIENLFLVNRQVHVEAEEVLYSCFVFYVHPRHQNQHLLRETLYNRASAGKSHLGPQLPEKVQNIQINIAFDPTTFRWGSEHGCWGSCQWLAERFSHLRKVGLAIDYEPQVQHSALTKQLMEIVISFIEIFRPTCQVHLRFAGVKYDRYAYISPASPPLYADMLEEEKLLLYLRDEKKLIWHKVAGYFNEPRSELYSVAGLQARYQRLKLRQQQAVMEADFLHKLKEELRNRPYEDGTRGPEGAAETEL